MAESAEAEPVAPLPSVDLREPLERAAAADRSGAV